jgi:heterodisulfide reductase subunit D
MNAQEKELLREISQCTKCKFCLSSCPLYDGWIRNAATGKLQSIYYALKYDLPFEVSLRDMLFSCTTCSSCQKTCEKYSTGVKLISALEKARSILVKKGIGPMPAHKKFASHIKREFNPYMEPHSKRMDWISKEDEKILPKKAEYVYFVGCTSSYRQKKIAQDTLKVLKSIGINFTILEDEWCCGSPLLRTGQWSFVKKLANHNIELINSKGADKVITSCAGCYRAFKKDYTTGYANYLNINKYDFQVYHITELLDECLQTGLLKLKELNKKVTYHDPCHLSLHMSLFDSPRNVIKMIPGVNFIEMPKSRENSMCCGAGGGFRAGFPNISINLATRRVKEAESISVDILASACPFCWRNLSDAIKKSESKIQIKDVVELIAENIII